MQPRRLVALATGVLCILGGIGYLLAREAGLIESEELALGQENVVLDASPRESTPQCRDVLAPAARPLFPPAGEYSTLHRSVVLDTVQCHAAEAALSAPGSDPVYAQLACPEFMRLSEDVVLQRKTCTMDVQPRLVPGVEWGPVASYLWSGDLGYWIEKLTPCPGIMRPDLVPERRVFCTVQIDFLELPPTRRMEPIWQVLNASDADPTLRMGYAVQAQLLHPNSCPHAFATHKAMCEELRPGLRVREFDEVVLEVAAAHGHVVMTIATYDYAEGALVWYESLVSSGVQSGVVVAMDLGGYVYLANRGVPVVLVTPVAHLNPCCLFLFKMVPWRATNDVKVRAIVRALELGVRVLMLDMDVIVYELARNFTHLAQFDLVYTSFYSFTYTYSAPSSTVLALWRLVLDMVLTGGWDQQQFGYAGELFKANYTTFVMPTSYVFRLQNAFVEIMHERMKSGKGLPIVSYQQPAEAASFHSLPSHTLEASHQHTLAAMLSSFPSNYSRLLSWPPSSPCANMSYSPQDWPWRAVCVRALVAAAVWSQRYVVLPDAAAQLYDVGKLGHWFPVASAAKLQLLLGTSPPAVPVTLDVGAADAASLVHVLRSDEPLVHLAGSASHLHAFSDAHCPPPQYLQEHMRLFVSPPAPDRARTSCVRGDGPATATNLNHKCSGALRANWDLYPSGILTP